MTAAAKKRVLVIDDAALVRAYYRQALERAGYEVDEALERAGSPGKATDACYSTSPSSTSTCRRWTT